jgi:hypothetical protein
MVRRGSTVRVRQRACKSSQPWAGCHERDAAGTAARPDRGEAWIGGLAAELAATPRPNESSSSMSDHAPTRGKLRRHHRGAAVHRSTYDACQRRLGEILATQLLRRRRPSLARIRGARATAAGGGGQDHGYRRFADRGAGTAPAEPRRIARLIRAGAGGAGRERRGLSSGTSARNARERSGRFEPVRAFQSSPPAAVAAEGARPWEFRRRIAPS